MTFLNFLLACENSDYLRHLQASVKDIKNEKMSLLKQHFPKKSTVAIFSSSNGQGQIWEREKSL